MEITTTFRPFEKWDVIYKKQHDSDFIVIGLHATWNYTTYTIKKLNKWKVLRFFQIIYLKIIH